MMWPHGAPPVQMAAGSRAPMKGGVAAILFVPVVMLLVGGCGVLTPSTLRATMHDMWLKEITTKPTTNQSNVSSVDEERNSSQIGIVIAIPKYSTNETCVTPEMVGEWTYVDAPNFTNALCCDPRSEYPQDHPYCDYNPQEAIRFARDQYEAVDFQGTNNSTGHLPWMQGQGCANTCRQTFRDQYVWKSPNLPSWDATEFCRLLGSHRRIHMVGDSTMGQAAATLISAVHGTCQTQLLYYIADNLIKEPYGQNRGSHWLDVAGNYSRTADGDIVVLTVGAHLADMHEMNNVSNVVLQQIMTLKQERPTLTIVYKTQHPGGCTREIASVSLSPLEVGKHFVSHSKNTYNHPLFYEYDQAVIRRLQELEIPFLDSRMLYSRSDAHPSSQSDRCRKVFCDCLHFCSPGPLDTFAILFLQLLRNDFKVSQCV